MSTSCRGVWKVFFRKSQIAAIYGILLAAQLVFILWCVHHLHAYQNYSITLREALKPVVIGISVFIFIGYELSVSVWEDKLGECLRVMAAGIELTAAAILVTLVCLAAVCAVAEAIGLTILFFMTDIDFAPFGWHVMKVCVLYVLVPILSGGLIGCALASLFKTIRTAAYLCSIAFLLLNTDFLAVFLNIPYNYFGDVEATVLLYQIKSFFTLAPLSISSAYSIDTLYGIPAEPVKWLLGAFWLILPLTVYCMGIKGNFQCRRLICGCTAVGLGIAGVCIFVGLDNTLAFDTNMSNYIDADQMYYVLDNKQDAEELDPGFSITAYKMTLNIASKLSAEVTVTLDIKDENREELHFTLYHGYELSSIQLLDGTELPFERRGDTVTIRSGDLNTNVTVVFRYKGYSAKYYSTSQAILLPAYFPYYPMAGIRDVWNNEEYGTNTDIRETEAQFLVEVNAERNVYSNLDGDGRIFSGAARGVTLYSGFAMREENIIYAPLKNAPITAEAVKQLETMLERLKEEYLFPYELPDFAGIPIFQTPENYTVNSNTEDLVFCGDHALMSSSDTSSMCMAFLKSVIPYNENNEGLQRYTAYYLVFVREIEENHELDGRSVEELTAGLKSLRDMDAQERLMNAYEIDYGIIYPTLHYIFHKSDNVQTFWEYFYEATETDYIEFLIRLLEG